MSAEVVLIRKLVKALQKIEGLSEIEVRPGGTREILYAGSGPGLEVTSEVMAGLCYAAQMAREALRGVIA